MDNFKGEGFKSGFPFIIPDDNLENSCHLVLIIIFEKIPAFLKSAKKEGEICLQDSSEKLQAHTYVWSDKNDPNLYGVWDFEVKLCTLSLIS